VRTSVKKPSWKGRVSRKPLLITYSDAGLGKRLRLGKSNFAENSPACISSIRPPLLTIRLIIWIHKVADGQLSPCQSVLELGNLYL